ncbi:MAG: hypothetical protein ABSD42_00325 [Candidatus Bathyarchaeia archaeon]
MPHIHNPLKDWLTRNRYIIFPALAFVIPLAVRFIPEILMGPYILGFDTLGVYVPDTLLWLHNGINLWNFLATAPLFYSILMLIVGVGGSPVFALKIISPLLLGFLGLSIFAYAKRGLGWSPTKSTFVALLGTIYFVALRASWDQLREELSLVFFFVVLTLLMSLINRKDSSWKHYVVLSLAMIAVVLSHQLVAVLMFGAIIGTVAYSVFRRDFKWSIDLVVVSLPAAVYFVIVYLSGVAKSGVLGYSINSSSLASWTGFASYQSMLISEGGFFLYCFLPLLPLVAVGLWRFGNLQLRSWLLLSFILLFIPLSSVSPYRWVLLLTYPLAFYATDALSRLKSIKWKSFKFTVHRIAVLYLILSTAILSFGFIFMTSENPFFYFNSEHFNSYANQIPISMLQNTISITDCHDTVNALQWFKNNLNSSALLLTHTAFYGWALLTLNSNQVMNYGFGDPVNAATTATQEGHSQIYLIWWVNGQGWYGQPTVSPSFHEVYSSGKMAIYSYAPS